MDNKTPRRKSPTKPDDPNIQIALKLRSFYRSVQEESVPQRFLDLLEQLDAVEQRHGVRAAD
ncbi:MAG: NepR family anti-sigma factor [Shinella sp.]|nr:NepR family anti-sigma factor [Shinella sp.]